MYIRAKFFTKKVKGDYEKPFLFLEVNGNTAIELFICQLVERFFCTSKMEKVKAILKEE